MAKNKGRQENLIPLTTDKAREIGRKGGKKSVEVRRRNKLLSKMIAEYLNKEHEVILRDEHGEIIDTEKISAQELIDRTVTAVLSRGDGASGSMIKTMADITEGNKIHLMGEDDEPVKFEIVEPKRANTKGD